MAKMSKRVRAIREKVELGKQYPLEEAVGLLKEMAPPSSMRRWKLQ